MTCPTLNDQAIRDAIGTSACTAKLTWQHGGSVHSLHVLLQPVGSRTFTVTPISDLPSTSSISVPSRLPSRDHPVVSITEIVTQQQEHPADTGFPAVIGTSPAAEQANVTGSRLEQLARDAALDNDLIARLSSEAANARPLHLLGAQAATELAASPLAGLLAVVPLRANACTLVADPHITKLCALITSNAASFPMATYLAQLLQHDFLELLKPIVVLAIELSKAAPVPHVYEATDGTPSCSGVSRCEGSASGLLTAGCGHKIHRQCAQAIFDATPIDDIARCPDANCEEILWFPHADAGVAEQPQDPPLDDSSDDDALLIPPSSAAAAPGAPAPRKRRRKQPDSTPLRCTCGRASGVQGRHKAFCDRSQHTAQCAYSVHARAEVHRSRRAEESTHSDAQPATPTHQPTTAASSSSPAVAQPVFPGADLTTPAPSASPPTSTRAVPGTVHLETTVITYGHIVELAGLPVLQRIPDQCVIPVSKLVTEILAVIRDYSGALRDNAIRLYFAFPKLVLCRPVPAKHGREESLTAMVRRRLHGFVTDEGRLALLEEARRIYLARKKSVDPANNREPRDMPAPVEPTPMDRHAMLEAPLEDPPERCFQQADNCFRFGEWSRGIRTMAAKPPAPPTEANVRTMRALHPPGGLPPPIPRDADFPPCNTAVKKHDVRAMLHAFDRGTSGGVSGWTPELMLQLARSPLAGYLDALAPFVERVVAGQVSGEHRKFIFSAKAIAHYKDAAYAALRPLAAGEVIRRGAGKLLVKKTNQVSGAHLIKHKQVAVGVKGGAEALIHAAAATLQAVRNLTGNDLVVAQRNFVFLQTDRRNAFNLVSREKFLAACKKHVPDAYAYAVAAYEEATTIIYGDAEISSETGCQQGCPLAMLLYALAEADADAEIAQDLKDALDLRGSYADDSNIAGSLEAVCRYHQRQKELAPNYGFEFNPRKYTLACHPDAKEAALSALGLDETCWIPLDEVRVLGTPVGSEAVLARETASLVDKAVRSIARFEQLPHAHRAASALWYGGKGLITHQMRTARIPLDQVDRLDDALLQSAANIYGVSPTPEVCARLSMGYKEGGWAYRRAAPFADIAYVASLSESKGYAAQLTTVSIDANLPLDLAIDSISSTAGSTTELATALTGHRSGSAPSTARGLQKKWSAKLNELTLEQRQQEAGITSRRDHQRVASCAGTWQTLHPLVTADQPWRQVWLNDAQLRKTTLYRLGEPMHEADHPCGLCGTHTNDVNGEHAARCMTGGHRTRMHNRIATELTKALREAMAEPQREVLCFRPHSHRMDIVCRGLDVGGSTLGIDVAVTGVFDPPPSEEVCVPGAAATRYEAVKWRKYAPYVSNCPPEFRAPRPDTPVSPGQPPIALVPFVVDAYGALGQSAEKFLPRLSKIIAANNNSHHGIIKRALQSRIMLTVQMAIADIFIMSDASPKPLVQHHASHVLQAAG